MIIEKHPEKEDQYAALVTFIPDFNQGLSFEEVFAQLKTGSSYTPSDLKPEIQKATGEFIFVVDRSGSMHGHRIDYLKNTL